MIPHHAKFLPIIDFAVVILTGSIAFVLCQGQGRLPSNRLPTLLLAAFVVVTVFAYSRVYIAVGSGLGRIFGGSSRP